MSAHLRQFSMSDYQDRIRELKRLGLEEDPPIRLDLASLDTFDNFAERFPFHPQGGLFLMDSGRIRATWRNPAKKPVRTVSIEFHGQDLVHMVVLVERPASGSLTTMHGIDDLAHVRRFLDAADLGSLLDGVGPLAWERDIEGTKEMVGGKR